MVVGDFNFGVVFDADYKWLPEVVVEWLPLLLLPEVGAFDLRL